MRIPRSLVIVTPVLVVTLGAFALGYSYDATSAFLKRGEGLWMALQGVFTPVGIVLALAYPVHRNRAIELETLRSTRNLACYLGRFVERLANEGSSHDIREHKHVLLTCHDALKSAPYASLSPPTVSEHIVGVLVQSVNLQVSMDQHVFPNSTPSVVQRLKEVQSEAAREMLAVDRYLSSRGVVPKDYRVAV